MSESGQTETRETFSLSSDSLCLRTPVIGCKAPVLRPVKTLGVAAATGVIRHRVHRLLSKRIDGVVSNPANRHTAAPFPPLLPWCVQ